MKNYREIPLDKYREIFVKSVLRRASYRWYPLNDVLKNARKGRNQYECQKCKKIFSRKEVQRDHIKSVKKMGVTFTWEEYVKRLYCNIKGLQVLCKPCHNKKTKEEGVKRRESR